MLTTLTHQGACHNARRLACSDLGGWDLGKRPGSALRSSELFMAGPTTFWESALGPALAHAKRRSSIAHRTLTCIRPMPFSCLEKSAKDRLPSLGEGAKAQIEA